MEMKTRGSSACRCFALAALVAAISSTAVSAQTARNVILLIGDGMGFTQKQAAAYLAGQPLNMDAMPVLGAMSNYAADNLATDSAAAATALATGYKTNNGMISVTPDGKDKATILERARDAGKATGLVATSTITHATPAGFGAHVSGRGDEAEIAAEYVGQRIDVLFGGGVGLFLPKSQGSSRKDERDLIGEFKALGYTYAWDIESLKSVTSPPTLGLFSSSSMAPDIDREVTLEPSLADMTQKAIDLLSKDPDGFFLMVEGSQVDWGCHDGDPAYTLSELFAFDKAVAAARAFEAAHPDTLVVVCADHETGGMTLVKGDATFPKLRGLKAQTATGAFIAGATGKEKDPAKITDMMKSYTGLTLKAAEAKSLVSAKDLKPVINKLVSTRAGITWATGDHSAAPVPVLAEGSGQDLFAGWYDNTDMPKRIAKAMGITL